MFPSEKLIRELQRDRNQLQEIRIRLSRSATRNDINLTPAIDYIREAQQSLQNVIDQRIETAKSELLNTGK